MDTLTHPLYRSDWDQLRDEVLARNPIAYRSAEQVTLSARTERYCVADLVDVHLRTLRDHGLVEYYEEGGIYQLSERG